MHMKMSSVNNWQYLSPSALVPPPGPGSLHQGGANLKHIGLLITLAASNNVDYQRSEPRPPRSPITPHNLFTQAGDQSQLRIDRLINESKRSPMFPRWSQEMILFKTDRLSTAQRTWLSLVLQTNSWIATYTRLALH